MKSCLFSKIVSVLSIDVVVGSVSSYYFFCAVFNVQPSIITATILGLTVWAIYTIDHLMDAKKVNFQHASSRHRFHKLHFVTLSKLVIFMVCAISIALFWLDYETLKYGVFLSCLVVIYFISVHMLRLKLMLHKEITVALLYTSGILLGPLSQLEHTIDLAQILLIFSFFHVALVNLLLFSYLDQDSDRSAGFQSICHHLGGSFDKYFYYISLQGIGLCLASALTGQMNSALLLMLLIIILIGLFVQKKYQIFRLQLNYRMIGDGVFCLLIIQNL